MNGFSLWKAVRTLLNIKNGKKNSTFFCPNIKNNMDFSITPTKNRIRLKILNIKKIPNNFFSANFLPKYQK